jgi:serine/threonine-protein kinase RsbW
MEKLIEFPSQMKNITFAEKLVDEICDKNGFLSDNYGNILISLIEAVNNAITHGNKLNPNKFVHLKCNITDTLLEFVVQDEGDGFDYNNVPDPTLPHNIEKPDGRGIFLMKNLADEIKFFNKGNEVQIKFNIS